MGTVATLYKASLIRSPQIVQNSKNIRLCLIVAKDSEVEHWIPKWETLLRTLEEGREQSR